MALFCRLDQSPVGQPFFGTRRQRGSSHKICRVFTLSPVLFCTRDFAASPFPTVNCQFVMRVVKTRTFYMM